MPELREAGKSTVVVRHHIPTIPEHPCELIGGTIVQHGTYNHRPFERYWLVVAVNSEADQVWLKHYGDIPLEGAWKAPPEFAPDPETTLRLSELAPAVRIGRVRFEGRVSA